MKLTDKIFYVENDQLHYDWKKIEKIAEFATLKKCEQNPKWHAEGDAFVHTKKVCEAMEKHLKFYRITYKNRPFECKVLMTAALFHDIGKGVTTIFKKGNWHAYGHEVEGEKITRKLLWDEGYDFREQVCSLVRWHMEPLQIFESKSEIIEKILRLSKRVNIKHVCLLKTCDIDGSWQADENSKKTDYEKVNELLSVASHLNCGQKPTVIPTDGKWAWKSATDTRNPITVYMMIGLPGAGKDTLINDIIMREDMLEPEMGWTDCALDYYNRSMRTTRKEDCVMLSRDDLRAELGFCNPGDKIVGNKYQEDKVTKVFNDKLKEAADNGKDIIVDAINLKKEYRTRIVESLANYRTRIIYVYVEADGINENVHRRNGQIERNVFVSMLERFEFPTPDEYDEFYVFINNSEGWQWKK